MSKHDKALSALGLNVRKNREAREFTQEKLAEKSGLDPTCISDLERGLRINLMTPEPSGGFYKDHDAEPFVRKFGYADKLGREDRMNFAGRHFVGRRCLPTGLAMELSGFDAATGKITDANGAIALVSDAGEVAAGARRSRRFNVHRGT